jgi:ribulose-phosphate 3-epimerase
MVNEPLDFVYEAISIKERLPIKGIISQIERMSLQRDYIEDVKRQGWQVGFSLDLATPIEEIEEASWDRLDVLQLMSIEAGFQGTPFSQLIFPKITETQQHLQSIDHKLELLVDGGIKLEMASSLLNKGIDGAVVGSGIWQAPDPTDAITGFIKELQVG